MRILFAVISISLLLFNLFGYATLFQWEQQRIRHELKQQLKAGVPAEDLYHFQFNEDEWQQLIWTKPNKEFKISHQFYDIVHIDHQDGKYLVQAVSDEQETHLFIHLAEQIHQAFHQTPVEESPSKVWQQVISEDYHAPRAQPDHHYSLNSMHATTWFFACSTVELNTIWNPPRLG